MNISEVVQYLEAVAPKELQADYDNAGLLTGSQQWECSGILVSLDVTEDILVEAEQKGCNLVVAHHPIIFKGLKTITANSFVERIIISAIKKDIAIYAIHTNLDSVMGGVNGEIANRLGLQDVSILQPVKNVLKKLITLVPHSHADEVREALFAAGAGNFSQYDHVSFNSNGIGTFTAKQGAKPFLGDIGKAHNEEETKMEVMMQSYNQHNVIQALLSSHPYQEVAYDIISLKNETPGIGSGGIGTLSQPIPEHNFMELLVKTFDLQVVKHTKLLGKDISRVALCGGSGSFLIQKAIQAKADVFVTADIKYHDFFEAEGKIVIADIGHYESEQYTSDLLTRILREKFLNFAVQKTDLNTNPVGYFLKSQGS
ncbi:MAG: Nif3-like dinuclear metal center hexameric protein [Ginsengibacter sp.]